MKDLRLMAALLCAALIAFLSGCGSDKRESSQSPQVEASQACLGCHNGTDSRVTGNSVVQDWLKSAHATAPGGAGCDDCHHVDGHPQNGITPALPTATVCQQCHTQAGLRTASQHFGGGLTPEGFRAPAWISTFDLYSAVPGAGGSFAMQTRGRACFSCHNPHDPTTLLTVNKQWAASPSGHGSTVAEAFSEDPFRTVGCGASRCHTASGFRYYVTNNQTLIPRARYGIYSSVREVIACTSCHTDYSWRRLATDTRVTNFVNFSTPYARATGISKNFPANVGETKICIPCHAGRSSGATANATNPHYFPAAGIMYAKIGFIGFTSLRARVGTTSTSYGQSLTANEDTTLDINGNVVAGGLTSTHRKLGTSAINGDTHVNPALSPVSPFVPGFLDTGGPCVTCHMAAGHNLSFDDATNAATIYNSVCINCHPSERGTPLTASNFVSAFVDENRDQMNNALSLAVKLLNTRYNINIVVEDIESPQEATITRFTGTGAVDYTVGGTLNATAQTKLRGAVFNVVMAYRDNASFLHARTYMRRIIYDTIDFLDDGVINLSVGATALGAVGQGILVNGVPVYGKNPTLAFVQDTPGGTNASTLTTLAAGTTPSMTYLLGFTRTGVNAGAWTTPERP